MENIKLKIGKNITKFQKESDLSPQDIQTRLNISKTTYYNYIKEGVSNIEFIYQFKDKFKYDLINGKYLSDISCNIEWFQNENNWIENVGKTLSHNKNFIIYDENKNILNTYGYFLEEKGYTLKFLNLCNLNQSDTYNPFDRMIIETDEGNIVNEQDISVFSDMLLKSLNIYTIDNSVFIQSLILYILKYRPKYQQTINSIFKLLRAAEVDENNPNNKSKLDKIFDEVAIKDPNSIALKRYVVTKASFSHSLLSAWASIETTELINLTNTNTINLNDIKNEKVAYFILYNSENNYNWLINMFSYQMAETIKNLNNISVIGANHEINKIYKNIIPVQDTYVINRDIPKNINNKSIHSTQIEQKLQKLQKELQNIESNLYMQMEVLNDKESKLYFLENNVENSIKEIEQKFKQIQETIDEDDFVNRFNITKITKKIDSILSEINRKKTLLNSINDNEDKNINDNLFDMMNFTDFDNI